MDLCRGFWIFSGEHSEEAQRWEVQGFAKGEREVGSSERYSSELVSCRSGILKALFEASGMTEAVSLLTTEDCTICSSWEASRMTEIKCTSKDLPLRSGRN